MELVRFCKALGDETRARIINLLLRHELNVGELVRAMDMGQSRVSRHLKILLDSGLVRVRRDGLWAFYRAVENGPARSFLQGAGTMLAQEGGLSEDLDRAEEIVRERVDLTRDFFDAVAPEWDRLSREILGDMDLRAELAARLGDCQVAADLGCGPGDLLQELQEHCRQVIGVDNSPKMLELAQKRFAGNAKVSLRIGELTHLPMRDWEADVVVLSMVLHHLSEPERAISEAARVLKLGGRLLIADFEHHDNERMRSEYGDHRLGLSGDELGGWLSKARLDVTVADRFEVNQGLTVIIHQCEKK